MDHRSLCRIVLEWIVRKCFLCTSDGRSDDFDLKSAARTSDRVSGEILIRQCRNCARINLSTRLSPFSSCTPRTHVSISPTLLILLFLFLIFHQLSLSLLLMLVKSSSFTLLCKIDWGDAFPSSISVEPHRSMSIEGRKRQVAISHENPLTNDRYTFKSDSWGGRRGKIISRRGLALESAPCMLSFSLLLFLALSSSQD